MHIERIKLKNFTAYPKLDLRLERGFNVIVGLSNIGKSQLLRAIRWALVNDASYREVNRIENGASTGETEVSLFFSNGTVVTRRQSTKENVYVLTLSDGSTQTFEKVGKGSVPDAIKQATGISYYLKGSPINFARQRGAAFLVDETPRDRTTLLSELSPLMTVFEAAAAEAQKASKRCARDAATRDKDIEALNERILALGDLDAFAGIVQRGEQTEQQLQQLKTKLGLVAAWKQTKQETEKTTAAIVAQMGAATGVKDALRSTAEALGDIPTKLQAVREWKEANDARKRLRSVPDGSNLSERLKTLVEQLRVLETNLGALTAYKKAKDSWVKVSKAVQAKHHELTEQRQKVLEEAGICPICNRPL